MEPKLILLNGNPGMGKTTLANRYVDEHPLTLNLDVDRIWHMMGQWQAELDEFQSHFKKLSKTDRDELVKLLSTTTPSGFAGLIGQASSTSVNRILPYYVPIPKDQEAEIWKVMKQRLQESKKAAMVIPEDELVEDAGLAEAA